MQLNNMKK